MKRFSILIVLLAIFNLLQAQEKYPGFPSGGMPACMEFIEANLNYSLLDSVLDNIEGKVVVVTQLDTLGNIFSAQVKKGYTPRLDEEALRVVNLMPRWKTYRINGVTLNILRDYNWLIKTLNKSCKYPVRLQKKNQEGILHVVYEIDSNRYITNPTIIYCDDRKFKKATLNAFKAVINLPTVLQTGKDTLLFQFKLDTLTTPVHPHADVLIFGYSTCDIPVLMRYENLLIAHTNEKRLEVGVPVCYLNERGDTIVPYGKYRFCQTDTIRNIGFVYENESNAKIVCIDVKGRKLFNVFKYDNGTDYVREGLFRITDDKGLIGFADTLGNIIIKPQFKFAFPFENGKAKVTFSGKSKEVPDSNGEKHYWNSSDWYYINRNGKMINN